MGRAHNFGETSSFCSDVPRTLRRIVATAVGTITAAALAICLAGCMPTPSEQYGVTDPFGSDYANALAALGECGIDDAKLLALQSMTEFTQETKDVHTSWMYLFGSEETSSSYTVFTAEGQPTVSEYGTFIADREKWDALAATAGTEISASDAFNAAMKEFGEHDEPIGVLVDLILYSDDEEDTGVMQWEFFVYRAGDSSAAEDSAEASPQLVAVYRVDIATGAISDATAEFE